MSNIWPLRCNAPPPLYLHLRPSGKCEKHCPQHIREKLADARQKLEGPLYRTVRKMVSRFAKF